MYDYKIVKTVTKSNQCYKEEVATFKRLNKAQTFVDSLIPNDAEQLSENSKFGHWYDVSFVDNIGNYVIYTIYSNKRK